MLGDHRYDAFDIYFFVAVTKQRPTLCLILKQIMATQNGNVCVAYTKTATLFLAFCNLKKSPPLAFVYLL